MKKTYDWNLRLCIRINNNKKIEIVCSAHTNIHQIKIQIAKKLNLSIFDTEIDIFYKHSHQPLKSTSTLLQNQIENNAELHAFIARLKKHEILQIQQASELKQCEWNKDESLEMIGLSMISSCSNRHCTNYNQDIEINHGLGNFHILELISHSKCQVCPYKNQHLRPDMLCKQITLHRCFYKLSGVHFNNCGIPIQKNSGFIKCPAKKALGEFLQSHPWNSNMMLVVKHL